MDPFDDERPLIHSSLPNPPSVFHDPNAVLHSTQAQSFSLLSRTDKMVGVVARVLLPRALIHQRVNTSEGLKYNEVTGRYIPNIKLVLDNEWSRPLVRISTLAKHIE